MFFGKRKPIEPVIVNKVKAAPAQDMAKQREASVLSRRLMKELVDVGKVSAQIRQDLAHRVLIDVREKWK